MNIQTYAVSNNPTNYCTEHSNHVTKVHHVTTLARRLGPHSIIQKIFKVELQSTLAPTSMVAPMEEDSTVKNGF